ncbi:MAG: cytochrome C [Alphaproteobacteria bacterium]|nr:cytochrome C [Alphaproteobacteria bacterium]
MRNNDLFAPERNLASHIKHLLLAVTAAGSWLVWLSNPASALPAFAAQTQQACSACHVGGYGPQLTPYGREFKLEGYTARAGDAFSAPVSAMAIVSYLATAKDQASPPAPHYGTNNNVTLDEAGLFLAGGYGDHFGSFAQITYDGVGRSVAWDNMDLRATDRATLGSHDVLFGVSLNNNPGIQDAWNTMPAWGFPYTGSDLAPGPAAATLISDPLATNVLGLSAYALWDSHLYTEAGLYWSLGTGMLKTLGVDPADTSQLSGAAPYFRVAWQEDNGDSNYEIGAFAMFANLYPGRDKSTGTTDRYSDVGLDASYQFAGTGEDTITVNARYTHESQNLAASQILGDALGKSLTLQDLRADVSYYYKNTYGFSVSAFDTWGASDPLLYASNRTFAPDSAGFNFQVDVTPWGRDDDTPMGGRFNMRVGLQYTAYTKFDGASSNYDGTGRNASDNNTVRLFTWVAM